MAANVAMCSQLVSVSPNWPKTNLFLQVYVKSEVGDELETTSKVHLRQLVGKETNY